jgi:hypothetical protein
MTHSTEDGKKPDSSVLGLAESGAIDNGAKALIRSRWYPGILQWPTLIIFAIIVYELLVGPISAHDNFGSAMAWIKVRREIVMTFSSACAGRRIALEPVLGFVVPE